VALFALPVFFRRDQLMRQEVIEDFGVVMGGMVSPHEGGAHGG
jgi:hypothetical protein